MERLCWLFLWEISSKTTKRTSLSSKDRVPVSPVKIWKRLWFIRIIKLSFLQYEPLPSGRRYRAKKTKQQKLSFVPTSAALLNKDLALFKPLEQHRCVTEHLLASCHRKQRCIDEPIHLFMDWSLLLISLYKCCQVSASSTVEWKWHNMFFLQCIKKPSTCGCKTQI